LDDHAALKLTEPPQWATILGSGAQFGLYLATAILVLSGLLFVFGKGPRFALNGFRIGAGLIGLAFGALIVLMVTHQFQFTYVFKHSDTHTPMSYVLAGAWAGQEGSFILWATSTALFGALAIGRTSKYQRWFGASYALFLSSLAAILCYETPFKTELVEGKFAPPEGMGLVPSLFNYWMVIHPPTIFLGFGSLAVLTCYAFAAMLHRDLDSWVPMVRPWSILSATLLGIGLAMGGFWAYETLGWGGFWAWDPVENTSFVPWMWALALVHGIFIQLARGTWKHMNAFLAGTSLTTFVFGTFLTRSGFLKDQSVHSFAEMNRQALWVLVGILGVLTLSFLGVWIWSLKKNGALITRETGNGWSREQLYFIAVALLLAFGLSAGIGMSIPLYQSMRGQAPKVVEEATYHRILVWMFVPLVLAATIGPWLSWQRVGMRDALRKLSSPLAMSLGLVGLVMLWLGRGVPELWKPEASEKIPFPFGLSVPLVPWILFLTWLTLFAVTANAGRAWTLARRSKLGVGGLLSHVGLFLALMGLIISRGFERKEEAVVQAGRPGFALGYVIELGSTQNRDFAKRDNTVPLKFKSLEGDAFESTPVLYYTFDPAKPEPTPVVRPAIHRGPFHDIYVAIFPMSFEAGDPKPLKPGEAMQIDGTTYKFLKMRRVGEAGKMGTAFFADMEVTEPDGKKTLMSPGIKIGSGNLEHIMADTATTSVSLDRMDAASGAAVIQVYYKSPLYPIDVFYKPMTILVWVGAGVMTLGGLMAALSRRYRPRPPAKPDEEDRFAGEPEPDKVAEHADV
jgi:cytochrome c-type biogenesis protein CcmF